MISFAFLAILFLIDLVEQIRRFAGRDIGLGRAAGLAALNIASSFYTILPLIALLAGIALFLGLARSSEMVAIRASGRSGLRALAAPAITAALVGAVAVAVLNPIVAGTQKRYHAATARIGADGGQTISLGESDVWLRQALPGPDGTGADTGTNTGGQMMIRARRASPDATTLFDATFLIFSAEAGPTRRIEAQSAQLSKGAWLLKGVKEWPLDAAQSRSRRVGEPRPVAAHRPDRRPHPRRLRRARRQSRSGNCLPSSAACSAPDSRRCVIRCGSCWNSPARS